MLNNAVYIVIMWLKTNSVIPKEFWIPWETVQNCLNVIKSKNYSF